MRRMWLIVLIGLTAVALLGAVLLSEPGYALLIYRHIEVETSLAVLVIAWLLMLVLAMLALALLAGVLRWLQPSLAKKYWQQWAASRRARLGFYALIGGRWERAETLLSAAAKGMADSLPAWLGAALAAHEQGDTERADAWLDQAATLEGGGELAALLLRARMRTEQGLYDAARRELIKAHERYAEHPRVVRQLAEVCLLMGDWPRLETVLPALKKVARDQAAYDRVEKKVLLGRLQEEATRPGFNNQQDRLEAIQQLWRRFSRSTRRDDTVVLAYVHYLEQLGAGQQAEQLIMDTLRYHWSDALIAQLGVMTALEAPEKTLAQLEHWLETRPANAALLLATGRVALQCKQWGKARSLFSHAAEKEGNEQAWAELARLLHALGDHAQAEQSLQHRVAALSGTLPALPLPPAS